MPWHNNWGDGGCADQGRTRRNSWHTFLHLNLEVGRSASLGFPNQRMTTSRISSTFLAQRSTSPLKTDLCQVHIWRCRRELRLLTGVVWRIELFLLSSKWGRDLDYRHLHLSPLSYQRRKWLPDSCQSSEPIRLLAAELCELRLSSYLSFLSHYCIEDC